MAYWITAGKFEIVRFSCMKLGRQCTGIDGSCHAAEERKGGGERGREGKTEGEGGERGRERERECVSFPCQLTIGAYILLLLDLYLYS